MEYQSKLEIMHKAAGLLDAIQNRLAGYAEGATLSDLDHNAAKTDFSIFNVEFYCDTCLSEVEAIEIFESASGKEADEAKSTYDGPDSEIVDAYIDYDLEHGTDDFARARSYVKAVATLIENNRKYANYILELECVWDDAYESARELAALKLTKRELIAAYDKRYGIGDDMIRTLDTDEEEVADVAREWEALDEADEIAQEIGEAATEGRSNAKRI